jgi:two-component system chemotaxis sensor kinase CheA
MSFEADEEILQDFLIEAGEILDEMSEQLVALENDPENMELLNGIFRGFHTVKGGAGFLNLTALVDICHITENIFDILRNGDRVADAELMDYILKALDLVNEMFDAVRAGGSPEDAEPAFLKKLGSFAAVTSDEVSVEDDNEVIHNTEEPISDEEFDALLSEASTPPEVTDNNIKKSNAGKDSTLTDGNAITDDEFEALLDELHGSGDVSRNISNSKAKENSASKVNPTSSNDEISDDEFESLLDELHGKGDSPTNTKNYSSSQVDETAKQPVLSGSSSADMIDDDEFESLLDELHGSNKGPTKENKVEKPVVMAKPIKKIIEKKQVKKTVEKVDAKPKATAEKSKKPAKKSNAIITEATVRVDTKRLDDIMNMVGELVLARNRLKTVSSQMKEEDSDLATAVSNLDIVTADLQGAVMKTRMQPIKKVFGRFPRVVRDLARSLKKEIDLKMVGEETDLDKNLVEALADPLVHLVRNSVDHGIEMPEERVATGKSRTGTITLSATQEGDHIMLAIKDDGKGIDADILRGIAVEKGMMDKESADRLTPNECYNLIFQAGFSTKKEISDISGRGVGMDVVKTKITQLNGSIDIESGLGEGTTILIKVPLTLAILPTLMIKLGEQAFAFPLSSVNEIFHLDLTKTNTVDGQLMVVVREKALPLFFLNEMLINQFSTSSRGREGHVVLAQIGTQTVGFVVDSLVGQEEVVIKPLGKSLQGTPGIAGATITSDGKIALILDIPTLLKHYA